MMVKLKWDAAHAEHTADLPSKRQTDAHDSSGDDKLCLAWYYYTYKLVSHEL